MSPSDDENDEVYRVDTVPPPPGEDDSYNAPTKVGAMPPQVLEDMKRAALEGRPMKPVTLPTPSSPPSAKAASEPPARAVVTGGGSSAVASRPVDKVAPGPVGPTPPTRPKRAFPLWTIAVAVGVAAAFVAYVLSTLR